MDVKLFDESSFKYANLLFGVVNWQQSSKEFTFTQKMPAKLLFFKGLLINLKKLTPELFKFKINLS